MTILNSKCITLNDMLVLIRVFYYSCLILITKVVFSFKHSECLSVFCFDEYQGTPVTHYEYDTISVTVILCIHHVPEGAKSKIESKLAQY